MPPRKNPLFVPYILACTHPGCTGRQKIEQALSAGLTLGSLVPVDPADPAYGRCPKCRRNVMKVMEAPAPVKPPPPKGFSKIPTE